MIKYCIFDLDGTLLNTLTTIRYYLNKTMTEAGYEDISEDECRMFIGDGARLLVSRALESKGVRDADTVQRILEIYTKAYDDSPLYLTEAYEGIHKLISRLKSYGMVLGVVSNKPDGAAASVVREFFGDSFVAVCGGRAGVPLKPSPEAPLALLTELGGAPDECAFIGDTAVDINTAKNMGAALAVGVSWGFRDESELKEAGADVVVSSADELYQCLIDA